MGLTIALRARANVSNGGVYVSMVPDTRVQPSKKILQNKAVKCLVDLGALQHFLLPPPQLPPQIHGKLEQKTAPATNSNSCPHLPRCTRSTGEHSLSCLCTAQCPLPNLLTWFAASGFENAAPFPLETSTMPSCTHWRIRFTQPGDEHLHIGGCVAGTWS